MKRLLKRRKWKNIKRIIKLQRMLLNVVNVKREDVQLKKNKLGQV